MFKRNSNKKSSFKNLKLNLCGLGRHDCTSYECLSTYERQEYPDEFDKKVQSTVKTNDYLDKCITPKAQTRSRSRLPIYYKTPKTPINKLKTNSSKESHQDRFQSTKLNNNSPTISQYPFLVASPDLTKSNKRVTSSVIEKILTTKSSVDTPNVTEITHKRDNEITHIYNSIPSTLIHEESESNELLSTINASSINNKPSQIYVCCSAYKAVFGSDLTVKFADRVQIIDNYGEYFVLVRNVCTEQVGYVPKICLKSLNEFLNNLV